MSEANEKNVQQAAEETGSKELKSMQAADERKKQKRTDRIYALIFGAFALVAAAVLVWNSGVIQRNTTAITIDGEKFNAVETNFYYNGIYNQFMNQFGDYVSMLGLDPSQPMKTQECVMMDDGSTWFDYFMGEAKNQMITDTALYHAATEEGFVCENLDTLLTENLGYLETAAQNYNASTGASLDSEDYLKVMYGSEMTMDLYKELLERSLIIAAYADAYDQATLAAQTPADLVAAYEANPNLYDVVDYEQVIVSGTAPVETDANGNTVQPTEEMNALAMAESKEIADKLYKLYQSGTALDKLPEAAEAQERANYSAPNGVVFTDTDISNWLFDSARKSGDSAVIESEGVGTYILVFGERYRHEYNLANVRHILITPEASELTAEDEGYEEDITAKKAVAKAKADEILAQWRAGEATEESFIELVTEYSEDAGSVPMGGLISNIHHGSSLVPEFLNWARDEHHKEGDVGIVESTYGYHIMYQAAYGQAYWEVQASGNLLNEVATEWFEAKTEGFEAVEGYGIRFVG